METTAIPRPETQVRTPSTWLAPRGSRLAAALIDSAIAMVIYLVAIMANIPEILIVGLLALLLRGHWGHSLYATRVVYPCTLPLYYALSAIL